MKSETFMPTAFSIWDDVFGYGRTADATEEQVLRRILNVACNHLNHSGRSGNMSLFRRDPFKDRLNLDVSTMPELNPGETPSEGHFRCKSENYDPDEKICYYNLNDRLLPEGRTRNDETSRETRGMTGFVCLTGHPLLLLGEVPTPTIRSQYPTDCHLIEKYGPPKRGCHIAESSAKSTDAGEMQYAAVPILSATRAHMSIGVLRYTAGLRLPWLNHSDLEFLSDVARVISAVIRHFSLERNNIRKIKLPSAAARFQLTGNYLDFLQFMAESFSSRIASIYVAFQLNGVLTLRLVDAYGT